MFYLFFDPFLIVCHLCTLYLITLRPFFTPLPVFFFLFLPILLS